MKPYLYPLLTVLLLLCALPVFAQEEDQRITSQKQIIAALEKQIAAEEQEIAELKQGKNASQEVLRRLVRQVEKRNRLLNETRKQAQLLSKEIDRINGVAVDLGSELKRNKAQYAEMAREAYRNYKHNNYLTYIFASKDFADVARKIANLRGVAVMRENKLRKIAELRAEVSVKQEQLSQRKTSLEEVRTDLTSQRGKLERDARSARADVKKLSKREQAKLRQKMQQEQQLDIAINELRKLTKGNKEGDSFSTKTAGLRLPVVAGRVKKYKENMAEIIGPKDADVVSIYDGKVVDIKRNRITNKYDVYIAHGGYITSYANLGAICTQKGAKVARNQQIGSVGATVDIMTMEPEYKMVFGIYSPSPSEQMQAENCFRK
ncbi:MAG: peptidoglycan DD-metalloendopeptidase family protein [Alistipes sp.]